jgi:hypothetical protein
MVKPHWHQRYAVTRVPRNWVRRMFFRASRAAALTDDGRSILHETLGDLLSWRPALDPAEFEVAAPYDLGRATPLAAIREPRPVFITARFRSGSTLLWNLFRHVDGCTAYYEPFNDRRWFDSSTRGSKVDKTHHVDNYWKEYDGLAELGAFYREDWIRRSLYMDRRSWDPDMLAYVRTLIRHSKGRAILQFNRIDFRLPWFRAMFPEAVMVHLYRHPRDQWCSCFPSGFSCPTPCNMEAFANNDHFNLLLWANDLKAQFPFLAPSASAHPYRIFYYIWKLSYGFGRAFSDYSLSFDVLVEHPEREIRRLLAATNIEVTNLAPLCALVEKASTRWPNYADDAWFREHETACEDVLRDFFKTSGGAQTNPR